MAEKNGRPFPLLSYVQGDAIGGDVVLLEALGAPRIFRFSHLTLLSATSFRELANIAIPTNREALVEQRIGDVPAGLAGRPCH